MRILWCPPTLTPRSMETTTGMPGSSISRARLGILSRARSKRCSGTITKPTWGRLRTSAPLSEAELERQLDDAAGVQGACDLGARGAVDVGARGGEGRVIQHIEEFAAEFELFHFGYGEQLHDGEVELPQA